jgi:4-hydroxybenzoate polyprenyltransferase
VPRGLVTLRELGWIGVAVAALQFALAVRIGWPLVGLLAVTWIYFALMSEEFFARRWLKARPVIYLFSHMLIMPLVDWFATGCDWVRAGHEMPAGLFWFLAASFCNGIVIELGRKIRAPEQEETGVETYSFLWGRRNATSAWLVAMASTLLCAIIAAQRIDFSFPVLLTLSGLWIGALALGLTFLRTLKARAAKGIEVYSGVWTLALYLSLGVVPLWLKK